MIRWGMGSSLLAIAALVHLTCADLAAQHGAVQQVHDPSAIKGPEGAFYVFSTGPGINIRRANQLNQWDELSPVFNEIPQWAQDKVPGVKDLWAPDIAFFNGKYHLYYTASTVGGEIAAIGLATNSTLDPEDLNYKWTDREFLFASKAKSKFVAIDPAVFVDEVDDVQTPWMAFGSAPKGISLIQLDSATGKISKTNRVRRTIANREDGLVGAPYIYKRDDFYYLFVSFDQCCAGADSTYNIRVGRAAKIEGPYVDRGGKKMEEGGGSMVLSGYGPVRGPGHCSVISDGKMDFLVHHFYYAGEDEEGIPMLQVRPIVWGNDGWPLPGEPGGAPRAVANINMAGKWHHSVGFNEPTEFVYEGNGNIAGLEGPQWQLKGKRVTFTWPAEDAPNGAWVDDCIISPDGNWYVGRNVDGFIVRGLRLPE